MPLAGKQDRLTKDGPEPWDLSQIFAVRVLQTLLLKNVFQLPASTEHLDFLGWMLLLLVNLTASEVSFLDIGYESVKNPK